MPNCVRENGFTTGCRSEQNRFAMSLRDSPSRSLARLSTIRPRGCRLQCPFLGWHRESTQARTKEAGRRNGSQAGSLTSDKSARDRQFYKFINLPGGLQTHDEFLQFFALIFANDITAERGEFDRDFFLGHWIPRIALGYIDAS